MAIEEPQRCAWCLGDPLYERYHDEEWGVPEFDGAVLFERLTLEGMQAGLSWLTVLRKRAHMQTQFFGFDMLPSTKKKETKSSRGCDNEETTDGRTTLVA